MSPYQRPPHWKDMTRDGNEDDPESRRLMSERIASEIRSAVLSGEMRPGTRIRQELLAAHFGASRIPVREALKQLENEGLVVMAPNRGAWIADVNSEESIEIYKIREAVEPLAIGESVPNLTDEDIETLDRIVRELEQVTTLEEYIQLDREFHLRTYSRARMPQLLAMVERFWNSTQHFRRQFVSETYAKDGFPFSDPQHVLIMDAIRARDVEAAQVLVRLHIRRTRVVIQAKESGAAQPPLASRAALPHARLGSVYRGKSANE
ncbi:DNA-binding GntR family transcriptional regulator [Bradyrhizobium sp. USDA 4518]|jgi:DNA-binding GntR family transcriptional regulator|uniref:Transcriptional regulator, GntR family n=3 Tax=Bradyrhizobium TaxID=374 RepID=A0A1G6ZWX2_9BRAD|nr:transcriptional regulator, GntR family [Bradyrhizobium brasilense]